MVPIALSSWNSSVLVLKVCTVLKASGIARKANKENHVICPTMIHATIQIKLKMYIMLIKLRARSRPSTIGNVRRPWLSSLRISRILLVSIMEPTSNVDGIAGINSARDSSRVHAYPVMSTMARPMAMPEEISPKGVREIGFGPPE